MEITDLEFIRDFTDDLGMLSNDLGEFAELLDNDGDLQAIYQHFAWALFHQSQLVEKILNKFKLDPIKERLIYCNGALVWNVGREYISKGSVIKTVTENYYKKMTIRNINTVRKLAALVSKSAEPHA